MRLWVSGPRIGPFRFGASFSRRGPYRAWRAPATSVGVGAVQGYVYVIEGCTDAVKVGFSNDPNRRLRDLQTGSPLPLRLVYSLGVYADPYAVEQEAHGILARHRRHDLGDDWFSAPTDIAVAAVSAAAYRLGALDAPGGHGTMPWQRLVLIWCALLAPLCAVMLSSLSGLAPFVAGGIVGGVYMAAVIRDRLWPYTSIRGARLLASAIGAAFLIDLAVALAATT